MLNAWHDFWAIIDGFFVPRILAMGFVLLALAFLVRTIRHVKTAVTRRDE
jgi:Na+-transporting methylmalonyl-CoA/oxaloacetate decarboxylase gamma subunit